MLASDGLKKSYFVLLITTLTFTLCFAVWMLNGVLITFLTSNQIYNWDLAKVGLLIGTPVLTGSYYGFLQDYLLIDLVENQ